VLPQSFGIHLANGGQFNIPGILGNGREMTFGYTAATDNGDADFSVADGMKHADSPALGHADTLHKKRI
jgi:hypothetical protein